MQKERAEAFFPLRATTTAADSKRDARAAKKARVARHLLVQLLPMVQDRSTPGPPRVTYLRLLGKAALRLSFGLALEDLVMSTTRWSLVRPLRAVSTVPTHRVGGRRRLWYARTRGLDLFSRSSAPAIGPSIPGLARAA